MLDYIWDRFWGAKAWWQAFFVIVQWETTHFSSSCTPVWIESHARDCLHSVCGCLWGLHSQVTWSLTRTSFLYCIPVFLTSVWGLVTLWRKDEQKEPNFFLICEKKKMWATCCVCVINRGGFRMWTLDSCSVDSFCSLSYSVGRWQMMNRKVRALATAAPKRVECEGVIFEWRW